MQRPRSSALSRALVGEDHAWGLTEQLLAEATDALRIANWQRGARKGDKPPKPIPRPGVTDGSGKRVSSRADALPLDEMQAWLGWSSAQMN